MKVIRIPAGFYDDHNERDLECPPVIRRVGKQVEIDADHPDMGELMSDARHYAEDTQGWCDDAKRYVYMARRLIASVERQV